MRFSGHGVSDPKSPRYFLHLCVGFGSLKVNHNEPVKLSEKFRGACRHPLIQGPCGQQFSAPFAACSQCFFGLFLGLLWGPVIVLVDKFECVVFSKCIQTCDEKERRGESVFWQCRRACPFQAVPSLRRWPEDCQKGRPSTAAFFHVRLRIQES